MRLGQIRRATQFGQGNGRRSDCEAHSCHVRAASRAQSGIGMTSSLLQAMDAYESDCTRPPLEKDLVLDADGMLD